MHLKQKYVKTRNNEIIVFSELLQHSEFKKFEPVSAGFISIGAKCIFKEDGTKYCETDCKCYGESISLGMKCDEEKDTLLAQRQILNKF